MDTSDILTLISDSAVNHQWVVLALAVICLGVPVVLKALGKSVPLVDQIVALVVKILSGFKKPLPPAPKPGEKTGVDAVVAVTEEKK